MAEIPAGLKEFIANHIHSISELEILLLLRDDEGRQWSVESIGRALSMHRPAVEPRLDALKAARLITAKKSTDEFFVYAPATRELAALVDELALWYESHLVSVTTLIFSKPIDKIFGFAESFRFRKEEEDK